MIRMVCLLLWFLVLQSRGQEREAVLTDYRLPIRDGRVSTRVLAQELLRAADSKVQLPEDLPEQQLLLNRSVTEVTVSAWNLVLRDRGLSLRLEEDAILLRVDEARVADHVDALETSVCRLFRLPREPARLHHLSPQGSEGPVVILVHGLDSSPRDFKGTCRALNDYGYDVYFFEYPNDDRIERNAKRLSEKLQTLPPDRREHVSIVTISMGGLITQTMLEDPDLYVPGVRRFIACVPPFQGSSLARYRAWNELGDLFESVIEGKGFRAPFGDGLGLAGHDLLPGSVHLRRLASGQRNPKVRYSILAGAKGIVPADAIARLRKAVGQKEAAFPLTETLRRLTLEQLDEMLSFSSGKGDGAVTLDSARLPGVTDRAVLPFHHLEFLTGDGPAAAIPALKDVLERLPETRRD